jgi:hypothetical protein
VIYLFILKKVDYLQFHYETKSELQHTRYQSGIYTKILLLQVIYIISFILVNIHRSLTLERSEFQVGSVINSVVSQVMILLRERGLQIIRDIPEEIKVISAYGDQYRIQQVLADFLVSMVRCAPSDNGWVEIQVKLTPKSTDGTQTILYLFRFVIMFPF